MNQNGLEIQLQKIEFIILQSQSTGEPIRLNTKGFQAAVNIFAHAVIDQMANMVGSLDMSDQEHEDLANAFNDDLQFMIKQYTNIDTNFKDAEG